MENQSSPHVEAGTLEVGIASLLAAISDELNREVTAPEADSEALKERLARVRYAFEQGDLVAAEVGLTSLIESRPESSALQAALLYAILGQQQWERAEEQEKKLLNMASSPEQLADFEGVVAGQLSGLGYAERAVGKLEELLKKYPERKAQFIPSLSAMYARSGRFDEAWNIVQRALPEEGEGSIVQLPLMIALINRVIDLKKWDAWSKVQMHVRHLLKSLTAENDRIQARVMLLLECQAYMHAGRFREAELYADLAYSISSDNEEVRELRKQMQEMHALSKELDKMRKDTDIHPGIAVRNMEWYIAEFNEAESRGIREALPEEVRSQVDAEPEKLMQGILQLRFRYPAFYRRYQEEWQEVYREKQAEIERLARK